MVDSSYDALIIGAGMSGLAAGIRLAMFDKNVIIFEKHSIAGGLNSYYQRKNTQIGGLRKFDVGLHALTNYIQRGEKGKPFSKLLKQLRLSYDDFKLHPQSQSRIMFPDSELLFTNDFEVLRSEVHAKFPKEKDSFEKLVLVISEFNELDLSIEYSSSRQKLATYIKDPLLVEMILCPLLIYGSAWEEDMDFAQFVIMFKSIYFEGFSRPEGGVRTIIDMLMDKFLSLGGKIHFKEAVQKLIIEKDKCIGLVTDKGEYKSDKVLSSAGLPETYSMVSDDIKHEVGKLSFTETILCLDRKIPIKDFKDTIVFYNSTDKYSYRRPKTLFDDTSAVFCCPDNYEMSERDGEGLIRITYMANYDLWKKMERGAYLEAKEQVFESSLKLARQIIKNFNCEIQFKDVFTPTTIERYTWHKAGTVYGSTDKSRNGKTKYGNLYTIGTDQGFLGIVGSILSGISMANLYGLMGEK